MKGKKEKGGVTVQDTVYSSKARLIELFLKDAGHEPTKPGASVHIKDHGSFAAQ